MRASRLAGLVVLTLVPPALGLRLSFGIPESQTVPPVSEVLWDPASGPARIPVWLDNWPGLVPPDAPAVVGLEFTANGPSFLNLTALEYGPLGTPEPPYLEVLPPTPLPASMGHPWFGHSLEVPGLFGCFYLEAPTSPPLGVYQLWPTYISVYYSDGTKAPGVEGQTISLRIVPEPATAILLSVCLLGVRKRSRHQVLTERALGSGQLQRKGHQAPA